MIEMPICMPLCLKHDAPRPCPICDKENFDAWNESLADDDYEKR